MAVTDTERLVVDLEARISQFERNFKRANAVANDNWSKVENRTKRAGDRMRRDTAQASATVITNLRGIGTAFAGGFLGGAAVTSLSQLPSAVRNVTRELADLKAEAARAGIGVEDFQALESAASESRVKIDALTDGIKELQLRADEFISTGKGSAAEAFERLGFSADELKAKLKDPSELFLEIIGRLQRLDKAAQIRVSDEIFGGTGGEQFVQLLERGETSIRSSMQAAREAGYVLDKELVDRAAALDRQFDQITRTVGSNLKSAIINAASGFEWFISEYRRARELANPENLLPPAERARRQQERDRANAMSRLRESLESGEKTQPIFTRDDLKPLPASPTPADKDRNKTLDAIRREKEAITALIGELEEELRLVGASEVQQQIAASLRKAGAQATDEQRAKITELVTAIEEERASVEQLETAMAELKGGARDVLGGMIADLRAGKSGAEVLLKTFDRIASKLIDIALDSLVENAFGAPGQAASGGVFGIVGRLFGFAEGGYTGDGGKREPAGIVHRGEYVINADATGRNRALLEAINAGKAPMLAPSVIAQSDSISNRVVNVAPQINITVEGSSRDAKADEELAGRIGNVVENSVRDLVGKELRMQLRPGGVLNR